MTKFGPAESANQPQQGGALALAQRVADTCTQILLSPDLWDVYAEFFDYEGAVVELGPDGLRFGEGAWVVVDQMLRNSERRPKGPHEFLFDLANGDLSKILSDFNFYRADLNNSSNPRRLAEELWKRMVEFLRMIGIAILTTSGKVKLIPELPKLEEALDRLNHFRIEMHEFGSDKRNVFRKEGEAWRISFGGQSCTLKEMRGFYYIAHLLQSPNKETPTVKLHAAWGPSNNNQTLQSLDIAEIAEERGDCESGESESAIESAAEWKGKAVAEGKKALAELHEELNNAERTGDIERGKELEKTIRTTAQSLLALTGKQEAEIPPEVAAARSAVSKAIKRARQKIRKEIPKLDEHLEKTLLTGYSCQYTSPEDQEWQF